MSKQKLAISLQGHLIDAKADMGCLTSIVFHEDSKQSETTLTHLQNAKMYLEKAHEHALKAEKSDGTVSTKGGGAGRGG